MYDSTPASLLYETPGAVERLGKDIFLKVPLYRARAACQPVYINPALFHEFFGNTRAQGFTEQASVLSEHFSVTLEATSGEQVGWAHVDYQADPLNLSLAGNRGSGRAYYTGKYFNIKGEKTPLATSSLRRFSDGLLEAERGIWETITANALAQDMENGVPRVLAILDMNAMCDVIWREEPVRRVKIIRIDKSGALDRIAHAFYAKRPLSDVELHSIATRFGILEAEKFMQRIIHGAWSPGNISPGGHLIDFDTVCGVKGRSMQHSSSPYHAETYFGNEYKGQLKILGALAADTLINVDKTTPEALEETMREAMQAQEAKRLIHLMGFSDSCSLYGKHTAAAHVLAGSFRKLARVFYSKLDSLSSRNGQSSLIHVFDFSCFFRSYALLKQQGMFTPETALESMMTGDILENPLDSTRLDHLSDTETVFLDKVYADFDQHIVKCNAQLDALKSETLDFIEKLDVFYNQLLSDTITDTEILITRAYIINEDRFYLFPAFTPSYLVSKYMEKLQPEQVNRMIALLIASNSREPAPRADGTYISDMRFYNEGYAYYLLNSNGTHQSCFSLFKGAAGEETLNKLRNCQVHLTRDEQTTPCACIETEATLDFIGTSTCNAGLIMNVTRDNPLMFTDITLNYGGSCLHPTDFLGL